VKDAESDRGTGDDREERGERPTQEDSRRPNAECGAETGEDADPVPGTHGASVPRDEGRTIRLVSLLRLRR
jgi:hypothetical protein